MSKRKKIICHTFEDVYKRLEEVILANSGSDEFEEIFKLVILKLWDEQHKTDSLYNRQRAEEILSLIESEWVGVVLESNFYITDEQFCLCRDIIKGFAFAQDGFEGIDAIFEFIISKEKKGTKGQFFTPRYIVDFCVNIINPKIEESILDPAVGSGAFLYHSYLRNGIKGSQLWGFDFDLTAIRVARLLFYVGGINSFHLHKLNSLLCPKKQKTLFSSINEFSTTIEDIKRIEKKKDLFDIILTNPPFAGEIIESEILENYDIAVDKKRMERDVLFLERCVELLNDGGRMAIVLPDNVFGGNENEYIRRWVNSRCRIVGVVGIPRNVFMPHTPVKTSILFLQKRNTKKVNNTEKIFFGICEKPGKDSRGKLIYKTKEDNTWNNVDHDLEEISEEFKAFIKENIIGW